MWTAGRCQTPTVWKRVRSISCFFLFLVIRNAFVDFNADVSKPDAFRAVANSVCRNGGEKEDNPIPLPPRDRNKVLLTAKPRHTRKHPLIIPASATLQRTLDKVTLSTSPVATADDPFAVNAGGK